MKHWIRFFLLTAVLTLTSCFWNSEKENAIAAVKQNMEEQLYTESKESFSEKPLFQKKFVNTVIQKSEFEVESEKEDGDVTTVVVKVKTVGEFGRYNLKEVLAKQNENRETNFNGGEALNMILKMVEKDSEKYIRPTYTVRIGKGSKVLSIKRD